MMRKYHVRFGGGPGEKAETSDLACGLPYLLRRSGHWARLTASVRWPARRVVGEARYPSARGCAGGSIGTEAVPAVGGLRDSAGAPWERGDVARTSALPPPNHALERTGHSGHPWPAWGCPCGPPLTASVRWPARRVVGEARYPSARGCAGGAIGTEAVPAVGGRRGPAGAPWRPGDVARTSALPPPNHALERTGHSGHPWPAWGCPCGPPLTASVRWPARRVVGEARYPSARGCAGGAIGTEAVP